MTLKGRVHNDIVTLDEPSGLPNGTEVEVRALPADGNGARDNQQRFRELCRQWKEATLATSSITEMATHPAYQQIIGMGPEAIPLILAELQREPDHWFWALRAITGEDPVPTADRGRLEGMAQAWLEWGTRRGMPSL